MTIPRDVHVPDEVREIVATLTAAGFEAWCVGGALRDALFGEEQSDFDVATSATPDRVRKLFPRTVPVGEEYGTIGVLDRKRRLHEVTTFRRDVSTDGRRAVVAFGVSLEDDLARRDFTINAIAYQPLTDEWRDPFGGARDLAARVLRAVGTAEERFREDYLRVLRAVRFAARFGLAIEPATWSAARDAAPGLSGLSAERVRDEWFKGLRTAGDVRELVRLWREVGAAEVWLPGLAAEPPASLSVQPRDPVLLTCALVPDPAATLRRLRASNAEIGRAESIAAARELPVAPGAAGARRWLARTGAAADDLLRLRELTHGAPAPWAAEVEGVRARGEATARKDLAVTGADLLAAGLHGPAIGEALDRLLERVLDDPALNRRDALLAMLERPA
ncbi:MAG: CCA tRNA nucleotidyltransferase [Bacillota bacterium]|jgi:tRNA nucleotidyltransferase (CCA-adding enzyme)